MSAKRPSGLFITGTDTSIGKTYVAMTIARRMFADGIRVGVYKPVLSGYSHNHLRDAASIPADCQDDDVVLWRAAGMPGELTQVCPQRFRAPIAPHLAARIEGQTVDRDQLRNGVNYWCERSDLVLVEGAGGLLSPISDQDYVADVAYDLGFPLLMVTPNRLGVINQTLQALAAAASFRGGLKVAAVVLNDGPTATDQTDLSRNLNLIELKQRSPVPVLYLGSASYEFDTPVSWPRIIDTAAVPQLQFLKARP